MGGGGGSFGGDGGGGGGGGFSGQLASRQMKRRPVFQTLRPDNDLRNTLIGQSQGSWHSGIEQ